jgi:NADH/NAD ratio-sensing transcriptional regulator Rex
MVNLPAVINRLGIKICVVAVTVEYAKEISMTLAHFSVLGFLNFSSALLSYLKYIP